MEQLALFALPRQYKDPGENVDSNEAAVAAHSDIQSPHLSLGNVSWKTVSSHEITVDEARQEQKPDILYKFGTTKSETWPWTRQQISMLQFALSKSEIRKGITCSPFTPPRSLPPYGAATSQLHKGILYFQGGLIDDVAAKNNIWSVEPDGDRVPDWDGLWDQNYSLCWPIETSGTGPGARIGHRALNWNDEFFIVFGGDTRSTTDKNSLDDTLYVLEFSETRLALR